MAVAISTLGSIAVRLDAGNAHVPRFPLRLVEGPAPAWQAQAQILGFLLEGRGPDEVIHRATACLGLLPQIAWAELDGPPTNCPDTRSVELAAANTPSRGLPGGPRRLQIGLADPRDVEATAFVESLLALSAAIYNREQEARRLADAAHTDPLTSLWNRRGFGPFLDQGLARAARTNESIALLLCDLDHFKGINDELGHEAGDRALQAVATSVREVIRPSDLGARLGGDEIAILLAGADARGAQTVADRLRTVLHAVNPLAPAALTLSIGIADTSVLGETRVGPTARDALVRAADEALYQAKSSGRDRATVHPKVRLRPAVPMTFEDSPTHPIDLGLNEAPKHSGANRRAQPVP